MKTTVKRALPYAAICVASIAATAIALRANAAGIPQADVLTYTGYLEGADGAPLTDKHSIDVRVLAAADASKALCEANASNVLLVSGRFQVPLPDCPAIVKDNPDLWLDVRVDGSSLGVSKMGAVPFAIEAEHATTASDAEHSAEADQAKEAAHATKADAAEHAKLADGLSAPSSAFRAHRNGTFTVANSSLTSVVYNQEDYDLGGEYDVANGRFTAKTAGLYALRCSAMYASTSPVGRYAVTMYLGGKELVQDDRTGSGEAGIHTATEYQLNAGDVVACALWQDSGQTVSVRGDFVSATVFSGYKIANLP